MVEETTSAPAAAVSAPVVAAAPAPVSRAPGSVTDRPVSTGEIVRAIVALKLKKKVGLVIIVLGSSFCWCKD